MRMKPEHVSQLCQLMEQPHLTMRSQLILVRRFARHLNTERELTRSYFKAEVKTAKAALPFTKRQLSKIEEVQSKAHKSFKSALLDIGAWVYQNDELLTTRYGFDGICDLLEVNLVHRAEVIEYAGDLGRAISAVAFVSGLEDSASRQSGRHPADWKDGPLFNVFMQMMMKAVNADIKKPAF